MNVVSYHTSLHAGLCHGPLDEITEITVDDKEMWAGSLTTIGTIQVNKPELFGGVQNEGGAIGTIQYLKGDYVQVMPEVLAAKLGRTSANCPAFRGIASLFFYGAAAGKGFAWKQNSPIIAQTIKARVSRAPIGLNPAWVKIDSAQGANFAHIIYECLTNVTWGMGAPAFTIDTDSFNSAAHQLYDEGLGGTMVWDKQKTIQDFVSELLSLIQGVMFLDPTTGKHTIALLRDDYDPATLPVLNEDNSKMTSFKRSLPGEVTSEITVSWTNPINEQTETVTRQVDALVAIQGQAINDQRDYYPIRTVELATQLCERDLRSASAGLATFDLRVDRSAWNLRPGNCFIVSSDVNEVDALVGRILEIDYGTTTDSQITLKCIEDIFSLDHAPVTTAPTTHWVDPAVAPSTLDAALFITAPYYFASSADFQSRAIDLQYPQTLAVALGFEPGLDTINYDLMSRIILPNGDSAWQNDGTNTIVERSLLSGPMGPTATNLIVGGSLRSERGPVVSGFVLFQGGDEYGHELAYIHDIATDGSLTLYRGALDTIPRNWAAGTPVWFLRPNTKLTDEVVIRSAGEIAYYKMLPRTSLGRLDLDAAPQIPVAMTDRPYRPLRPANVKINGVAFADVNVSAAANIDITWATRNRTYEDGQVFNWADGATSPEYGQHTVVQVYNGGTLVYEHAGLYLETSLSLPKDWFARYASVAIVVLSRRGDLASLQAYRTNVTGLANNPAAALPPAWPAVGIPPSMAEKPVVGDFTVIAGPTATTSGQSIPSVSVSGVVNSSTAKKLLIRYRENAGAVDWRYHPATHVYGTIVRVDITAVKPQTDYLVEIAYGADGEYDSDYVYIGHASSGQMVANDVTSLNGRLVTEVLADLDTTGEQLAAEVLRGQLLEAEIKALVYDGDGKSIKLVVMEAIDKSDTAIARMNLLGAVSPSGTAFVLDATKVMIDGTTTLAQYLTQTATTVNGHTASITTLLEAINGLDAKLQITVDAPGGTAAIILRAGSAGSVIAMSSDEFYIFSGSDASTRKKVFGFSGGLVTLGADVRVSGSLIVDGSLTIGKAVVNFAVQPSYAKTATSYHGNGSTIYTLCETTITLTTAGYIETSANVYQGFPSGNDAWNCWLYVDGVADEPTSYIQGAWTQVQVRMDTIKYKPAGTYTVQLKWKGGSSVENVVGVLFAKGYEKTS
ncbi:hypothetical protein AEAC466_04295 [Asticcacaulis sp. AC466]|nr:hypothetical protein AEAC466_04295 [Asticcacaulis sp. AC466]